MPRKPYPTDVSDEKWSFAGSYVTLMEEAAPQRRYDPRKVFNALRLPVREAHLGVCCPTTPTVGDPPGATSSPVYTSVSDNLSNWIEAAIAAREKS